MLIALTTVAAAAKKGSGSSVFFLLIILALGAMWLIVIRPQRRKQKMAQSMQSELQVGDEVLTAGGVYAKVTQIGEDEVHVEIAPNVEIRLARRAIAAQLTEHEPDVADPEAESAEPEDAPAERDDSAVDAESDAEKPG
jgi:preprotein translocase subunit YajC